LKHWAFDQFHATLEPHAAVTNEIFALREVFERMGCSSNIYAGEFRALSTKSIRNARDYRAASGDLLLIHYSHGSSLLDRIFESPSRKILLYHNVTPARYLAGLDPILRQRSEQAIEALPLFADRVEAAVTHSEFSARDLRAAGYRNVEVLPFTMRESLYQLQPDRKVLDSYRGDGWKNLLVVSRILPHKCVERSLFVLDYLKRFIDPRWRLILIGSWTGAEAYRERLLQLIHEMDLKDVVWAGSASQAALLAYFEIADALLFVSDHEGFGVPLVEAMRMDVPVVAYASSAVSEVLNDAGVLFDRQDWALVAESVALLASDPAARDAVIRSQRKRREFFSRAMAEQRWCDWFYRFTGQPAPMSLASPQGQSASAVRIP
jgi:glycosyltransferase involved in cell wall biosynthesis